MPSITDIQQQPLASSNNSGKSTPPPTQTTTTTTTAPMDTTNADPLTQAILMLEKKQRNLGKRKEKLEGYQEEAKKGKELNKDQKDALAKYPDVLGQIECLKELNEQFKKIQTETARNQKRLSKQAADEKRQLVSQSLRQYAQIRYLLEHQPTSLKPEESLLLDKLSAVIIPSDNSSNSISRSVDTVLSIYQNGPASIIKNLTEKTPQEVREILEELIKNSNTQEQQQQQQQEQEQQQQQVTSSPTPEQEQEQEKEQSKEVEQTNTIQSSNQTFNDYPLQFDTRNQQIPLEQIIQDTTFFPNDLNNEVEDNNRDQSPDPKQYLPTITVVNSNINDQSLASIQNQQQDNSANVVTPTEAQQVGEQGQHRRGSGSGNRNYNRGGPSHYNQHQWRGPRGGRYINSYGSGQRPYHETNRGRGGPNYRNNRGGAYRGNNRGYNNNNGNGYQQTAQYQQAHSAPSS